MVTGLPPGALGSATIRVHKAAAALEILFFATRQDVKRRSSHKIKAFFVLLFDTDLAVCRGLGRLLNARLKDIALALGLTTIVVCSKQQRQEFWCKPSIGYTRVASLLHIS